jgi:hypothetical protein
LVLKRIKQVERLAEERLVVIEASGYYAATLSREVQRQLGVFELDAAYRAGGGIGLGLGG